MSHHSDLSLIVAMTPDGVIGRDGKLPWHLPEDLAHFKRVTMGHPIIMGRKTYESIGRPLPGRRNIVVTRNRQWTATGVAVAHGLDDALAQAGEGDIFVIGGAELYAAALPRATRLYVTLVHADLAGDTHFPQIDASEWHSVSRSARQRSRGGHDYTFIEYRRNDEAGGDAPGGGRDLNPGQGCAV